MLRYWQAYDRLHKPGRWNEVEWSLLDEDTRRQRQSDALRDMIRGAKHQTVASRKYRNRRN